MFDFDVRAGQDTPFASRRSPAGAPAWSPPWSVAKLPDPGSPDVGPDGLENLLRNRALREDLSEPIARIPRPPTVVLAPSAVLPEALQLMTDRNVTSVVVASHDVLLGVLTERDLLRRLLVAPTVHPQTPVWQVMSVKPETLLESDAVAYAIRKLRTLGARAMPVVRSDGAMSGLLDSQDIIAWLCDRVSDPRGTPNQPPQQI